MERRTGSSAWDPDGEIIVTESEPEQMTLFDMELPQPPDEKHQRLNAAMEAIRKRYGNDAVKKAS